MPFSRKDIRRYLLTLLCWALLFFGGPIFQTKLLFCYLPQELEPLYVSYRLFGFLSLMTMVLMEWFVFRKPEKVMLIFMGSVMMKFGLFVVYYQQLEGVEEEIIHSITVPILCFLLVQTLFIVTKLNAMDFSSKGKSNEKKQG